MLYLKKYPQDNDYETVISDGKITRPNISYIESNKKIHYNPILKVPEYAVFWGLCKAKTVDAYWGNHDVNIIDYSDNHDGTYTYYGYNANHSISLWDRFVWYNSKDVINFYLSPKLSSGTLRNNRFNSAPVQNYYFGPAKIKSNSLRESFYDCPKLKSLNISNWDLSETTSLYALLAMNIGGEATEENITALREVNMPNDMPTPLCTEVHKMFAWNRGLKKITGMKTVDFSAVTNFSEMFCEDRELTNVEFKIDNWVTDKATDIHSMFLQCFKLDLTTLGDLTTWNVSNVTDFSFCLARTASSSIDISGWNMSSAKNIEGMFMQFGVPNNNLKSINMSGIVLNPDNLSNASNLFGNCTNLQKVILTEIDNESKNHGLIDFIKSNLLSDILDTVKSGSVQLVLDDGIYIYNSSNQEWQLKN